MVSDVRYSGMMSDMVRQVDEIVSIAVDLDVEVPKTTFPDGKEGSLSRDRRIDCVVRRMFQDGTVDDKMCFYCGNAKATVFTICKPIPKLLIFVGTETEMSRMNFTTSFKIAGKVRR